MPFDEMKEKNVKERKKKKEKKKKEKKGRLKYIGSSSFHLVHEGSNILVVLRVNPKKIRSF